MPLETMIRITSDMSVSRRPLITEGVMVSIPWKSNVPITTFVIVALFTEAPPSNTAATAGKAM